MITTTTTMVHTSSLSLLCPSTFTSSSHSLPPFHTSFHAAKPFLSYSHNISCSIQATHDGLRVPPLYSTATTDTVETSEVEVEFVDIGYISDVHGLQGDIRVKHNTDFPELRFGQPGKRWLRQQYSGKENIIEVELVEGRGHPGDKSWIVKLSGFDDVDQARQLVGSTFLVRKSDRPELEDGEYYSRDLVGMRVILKDTGEALGTVVNVFFNGGNDLLHVMLEGPSESPSENGKQKQDMSESGPLVWIPFVEAIVPVVDLDKREMQISPPKGLLELNLRANEKSKKERRLLEWKERKQFQRRLISAKKKLRDLDQEHIFHGFRYGEKSQTSFLSEQIVSVNSNLLQQALPVVEMRINGCDVRESKGYSFRWNSGNLLTLSEEYLTGVSQEKQDAYSKHREIGLHLISEGKVATVLVLNSRKLEKDSKAEPVDTEKSENPAIYRLETLLSDEQKFIKAEQRESVPLILISPAEDIQLLEELFASHDYFNFNSEKVRFLAEEKVPIVSNSAVEQKKNKVLMKSPWEILKSPIGSGGTICALSSNNILEELIKSGVQYIEICSINENCLCGNPVFIGFVQSCEADVGFLTFDDKKDFEDNFHVVLPIKSMKKLLQQAEKLPFQAILETNSHVEFVNKEWVDIIPSTPNSYEFRCSIESLLVACSLEKSCLMEVTH